MKNQWILPLLILSLGAQLHSAPTNQSNIALEIKKSLFSTFSNTGGLFDGVIDSSEKFSALTGSLEKIIQQCSVTLPNPSYLRELKVFWDLGTPADIKYQLQYSQDGRSWFNLKFLKTTTDKKSRIDLFNGQGRSAKAVRLMIYPNKDWGNKTVRIQELEIYPNMDSRNTLKSIKIPVVTDKEAIVEIDSSLEGKKWVEIKQEKNQKSIRYQNNDIAEEVYLPLKSNQSYFYVGAVEDFNRNQIQSELLNFKTEKSNLALGKSVEGSFNLPARDQGFVNSGDLNARITDGGYDVFTQMSNSGSIHQSAQFFSIDLEKIMPVKKIVLFWRGLAYPEDYSVQVSTDGKTWKNIAQKLNASQGVAARVPSGQSFALAQVQQVNLNNNQARYIRVQIPQDAAFFKAHSDWDFVQIYEAKVF